MEMLGLTPAQVGVLLEMAGFPLFSWPAIVGLLRGPEKRHRDEGPPVRLEGGMAKLVRSMPPTRRSLRRHRNQLIMEVVGVTLILVGLGLQLIS